MVSLLDKQKCFKEQQRAANFDFYSLVLDESYFISLTLIFCIPFIISLQCKTIIKIKK